MGRRRIFAILLSAAAAGVLATPAMAASPSPAATSDLIPGPPTSAWTVSTTDTGPMTVNDIYGSSASSAHGFTDAYRKVWSQSDVGLADQLEHYTTVLWAAYALGGSQGADQKDATHTSFKKLSGFGSGAYEVTYPADSQGFKSDTIVFSEGDYLASISMAAKGDIAHDVLLDQARRQFSVLPVPTAEYRAIGYGVIGVMLVAGLVFVGVVISVVVLVVLLTRRRPATVRFGAYAVPYGPAVTPGQTHLSDDGRHWWDGQAWQDTTVRIPPSAQISPDGTLWWDGRMWRPMPSARG